MGHVLSAVKPAVGDIDPWRLPALAQLLGQRRHRREHGAFVARVAVEGPEELGDALARGHQGEYPLLQVVSVVAGLPVVHLVDGGCAVVCADVCCCVCADLRAHTRRVRRRFEQFWGLQHFRQVLRVRVVPPVHCEGDGVGMQPPDLYAKRPARSQQSNTDQQMWFRNRWSSSTSSRIASGS